jgi:hypothetical protein
LEAVEDGGCRRGHGVVLIPESDADAVEDYQDEWAVRLVAGLVAYE